jgi:dihydrofolate reductase
VSTVIFDMSMSLDGYVRAANPRPDEPLGEGGEALHAWAMDDDDAAGRDVLNRGIAGTGAVICGRVTYDDSIPWWQAGGPTGSAAAARLRPHQRRALRRSRRRRLCRAS